jgi:type II secretory pathway component GspD/PulD (secretin)
MKNKLILLSFFTYLIFGKDSDKTISLNFINEPIANIVNKLASLKKANIILPLPKEGGSSPASALGGSAAPKDFFDIKVNLYKEEKVTADEAWSLLTTFLNVSGYSIYKRKDSYQIKLLSDVNKAPLPLYVNVPINSLPDNNEQIRYIYYFKKISVYNKSGTITTNLKNMLNSILINPKSSGKNPSPISMPGSIGGATTDIFEINHKQNSLIITNPSSQIKAVMKIITHIDKKGFDEVVEVIPIKHAHPNDIEKLLTQLVQNIDDDPFLRFGPQAPSKDRSDAIFSANTRIIAMDRIKSVAVIGSKNSIKKVSKFINENLDIPISEGLSLIHVKPLQYLKSDEAVAPLKAILKNQTQQASSGFGYNQSKTSSAGELFSNVIITSEVEEKEKTTQTQTQGQSGWGQQETGTSAAPTIGGNNLIIAAKELEWLVINKLIDQLDQPQLQVAIETLIVDVSVSDDKLLAAQMRNPLNPSKPGDLNWQTTPMGDVSRAQNSSLISTRTLDGKSYKTVAADLGEKIFKVSGTNKYLSKAVSETIVGKGSTILTFRDDESGIAAILQMLDKQSNTTILSQPFVVTANNQQANITSSEIKWVDGGSDQASSNGNVIISKVQIDAKLEVSITPRINKNGKDVNLEIKITANEFAGENNNKLTRQVVTNSHMKNKQVLVLGGLTKSDDINSEVGVPILSKIPVIGSLFKKRSKEKGKKMLMIFISPRVIKPQIIKDKNIYKNTYTHKKIKYVIDGVDQSNKETYGDNFENLEDPITRLFFSSENKSFKDEVDNFSKTGIFSIEEKKY